jgi:hypothetical protein
MKIPYNFGISSLTTCQMVDREGIRFMNYDCYTVKTNSMLIAFTFELSPLPLLKFGLLLRTKF